MSTLKPLTISPTNLSKLFPYPANFILRFTPDLSRAAFPSLAIKISRALSTCGAYVHLGRWVSDVPGEEWKVLPVRPVVVKAKAKSMLEEFVNAQDAEVTISAADLKAVHYHGHVDPSSVTFEMGPGPAFALKVGEKMMRHGESFALQHFLLLSDYHPPLSSILDECSPQSLTIGYHTLYPIFTALETTRRAHKSIAPDHIVIMSTWEVWGGESVVPGVEWGLISWGMSKQTQSEVPDFSGGGNCSEALSLSAFYMNVNSAIQAARERRALDHWSAAEVDLWNNATVASTRGAGWRVNDTDVANSAMVYLKLLLDLFCDASAQFPILPTNMSTIQLALSARCSSAYLISLCSGIIRAQYAPLLRERTWEAVLEANEMGACKSLFDAILRMPNWHFIDLVRFALHPFGQAEMMRA